MKHILRSAILAVTLLAASCAQEPEGEGLVKNTTNGPTIINASSMAVNGEIILKLHAKSSSKVERALATRTNNSQSGLFELDRILNTVNTVRFERLFPQSGRFEQRTREEGMHLWYYAQYDASVSTRDMAQMLSQCTDVELIEYSLPTSIAEHTTSKTPANQEFTRAMPIQRNTTSPFNESERAQALQWHYNNTGKIFAIDTKIGADINLYDTWNLFTTGNPDVIVSVVDQGVKYDHEDLAANMWINKAELSGTAGVDDDGNGYVDDIYGYNFSDNSGKLTFSQKNNHGTHVAGTIAAVNNNGVGVCGIAGGSGHGDGVRVMSCEILGSSKASSGLSSSIRAIKYGADNGAVISQNSWGYTAGTLTQTDWTKGSYSALSRAIAYFIKYAGMDENGQQEGPMAGGLVVFAAGNDAMNALCYPAADPNVISVASTGFTGKPSSFTNYGPWVSLSAPGGDLALSTSYGGVYSTSVAEDGSSSYEAMQGTSMACPHVSGACALAISHYYGHQKRMGLTPEMLRQALLSSTNAIDPVCTDIHSPYMGNMGIGSLDCLQLLHSITKSDGIPSQRIIAGQSITLNLSNYFVATNVLTYSVANPTIIEPSLNAGILTIKGLKVGRTTITLSDGLATRKIIEVVVE